jgi:hypothetical protein
MGVEELEVRETVESALLSRRQARYWSNLDVFRTLLAMLLGEETRAAWTVARKAHLGTVKTTVLDIGADMETNNGWYDKHTQHFWSWEWLQETLVLRGAHGVQVRQGALGSRLRSPWKMAIAFATSVAVPFIPFPCQ